MAIEARSLTGRTLGDFTVQHKIGEGGHGVVYRAEQRTLGREAVIKVLHARFGATDTVVQRFLQEAKLASRLDHPFAAHIYAFGAEPDGVLWIAMELVHGTPLDRLLAAGGPLAVERFVPLFERICEVVQTAHDQGIVHRDLKPSNVMVVSRAGRLLPKLVDFGIARSFDLDGVDDGAFSEAATTVSHDPALTRSGQLLGSPPYMAPEQWSAT